MRILVAGASGVLGSRVVRLLGSSGHQVFGTTRRPDRVPELNELGATGVVMDALDQESVVQAVRTAAPDAIVHQLTDLSRFDYEANARLRVEGTRNLVGAANEVGLTRLVAQSISWTYGPGPEPATEDEPPAVDPQSGLPAFPSVVALEEDVLSLAHGVVLRYGVLYGPGTWYAADGALARTARRGEVVATTAATSFVHVDDAAEATVAALDWAPGVVNIVDDEPTDVDEWGPLYVEAVGGTPTSVTARAEGRAASNARARHLGWTPRHPSWRRDRFGLGPAAA